ncbi:MAG: FecR domain-containing protein, partial [Spirochaetes bacterium]|nr:FecR domain-containing protein [Spirochaetota bacterium]
KINMEVKAPTRIKTGKDSTVEILLQDKSVLKIGAESDFLIETWNFDPKSGTKKGFFKLFSGKVMAVVTKLSGSSSFQIITNNGVASVRGTKFGVNLKNSPNGALMDILVFNGQVAVGALDQIPTSFVNAGQMLSVAANSVLSAISEITTDILSEFNNNGEAPSMDTIETELPDEEQTYAEESQGQGEGQTEQTQTQTQTTQTEQLTGEEAKQAEQKVQSELEKWIEKYLNMIGDFGSIVIEGKVWSTFTVDTEFDFGTVGFALYMPIIYGNDLFNPTSWYNYESYHLVWDTMPDILNSVGKILSIFRYFRIGYPDDPFYLKLGQFDDFILGNGMNLYMYSNMFDFPQTRRLGINMNMLLGGFGINLAIDQITKPEIVGLRPYIQFIKGIPFYFGFEATADLKPLYDETSTEPVYGSLATGFTFPIVRLQTFMNIIMFADASVNYVYNPNNTETPFYITNGFGVFAGLRGNVLFINYRAEYRFIAGEYLPQIFSIDYQKKRDGYVDYFLNNTSPMDFSAISQLIGDAKSGLFIEASFDLFNKKITGYASWAHYFYNQNSNTLANDFLTAGITMADDLFPPFEAIIEIIKPDFLVPDVPFFENLSMSATLGYTVSKGIKIFVT